VDSVGVAARGRCDSRGTRDLHISAVRAVPSVCVELLSPGERTPQQLRRVSGGSGHIDSAHREHQRLDEYNGQNADQYGPQVPEAEV